jgi:hypothetical protein
MVVGESTGSSELRLKEPDGDAVISIPLHSQQPIVFETLRSPVCCA